jgi:alpha-D-ribose 1-methylphosphonate 5-triphosphate synthase subunit PhnI
MYATLDTSPGAQAAAAARARLPRSGAAAGLAALLDQVCAEAGVWAPDAASRALVQAHGDIARAVTLVRVWAATLPDLALEPPTEADIRIVRRVSAAFQQVTGGQWLGDAPDLDSRLLDWADAPPLPDGNDPEAQPEAPVPPIPTRAEVPRIAALLESVPVEVPPAGVVGDDPTRVPLVFPAQRESVLAALARAETGALVSLAALALARRREAVLTEATVLDVGVAVRHPRTGRPCTVSSVPCTEAEIVADADVDGRPGLRVGYGASLGRIERRSLAAALLDGVLREEPEDPTPILLDGPTVTYGVDGQATAGFVDHLRLPHYASFGSYLDQLRTDAEVDT